MTAQRQDSPASNLCQFQFAEVCLCSMPAIPSLNGFCRSHAALNRRKPPVEEDLSSELSQFFFPADIHLDVHRALERIFKAMAANRITTRHASTTPFNPCPASKNPVSPLFPLLSVHPPVTPLFPLHTQSRGVPPQLV